MRFQFLRVNNELIVPCLTPKDSASCVWVIPPFAYRLRIQRTCVMVNLQYPRLLARPFASMSSMLSLWVPRNKWVGFTHRRLSQRWRTCKPLGMEDTNNFQASRCALAISPSFQNRPYPPRSSRPVHSTQPLLAFLVFGIKRSMASSC